MIHLDHTTAKKKVFASASGKYIEPHKFENK